nr:bifunctional polynucleotide phosphatase kinase [Mimivirus sp.]
MFIRNKKVLDKGKNIVIDNTNPDILSRMEYTSLAKQYGYKHIRAIIINTEEAIYKHLNNVRHIYSQGKIPKVSDIAYNIYKKITLNPKNLKILMLLKLSILLWKKIIFRTKNGKMLFQNYQNLSNIIFKIWVIS